MNPIVFRNEEQLKSIMRRADAKNWARALVFIAVNEILTVEDASVMYSLSPYLRTGAVV